MKLKPNVYYNCNCQKLTEDIQNNIPDIILSKPKKKTSQIITFYKKNNKNTLF